MLRCLRPRRLLFKILYFSVFSLSVVLLIYNIESFCPEHNASDKIDTMEFRRLEQKSKALYSEVKKLSHLEQELRRMFPSEVSSILNSVDAPLPVIYAITPTYARAVQKAELTRLMHTFLHVPNFHWIVVEDSDHKTNLVANLLQNTGLTYTHLNAVTPPEYKMKSTDPNWLKPRGVLQRNKGMDWIRENINPKTSKGVVYFADDDNTYSLQLFKEMRNTTKVSVWPVGIVGYLRYESPIVRNNKVVGWFTAWKDDRLFATDMAGFAVNMKMFFDYPQAKFSNYVKRGELESELIKRMHITLNDLEPKADKCTKVYVWHTRTEVPSMKNEEKLKAAGRPGSDLSVEV